MPAIRHLAALSCILLVAAAGRTALAQPQPLEQIEVDVQVVSGAVWSTSDARTAVWAGVVQVPGAPWIRLRFDEAELGLSPFGGELTLLRITSFLDGHVQYLNAAHLAQWGFTSAYFNGDAVLVEIIADPGAEPSSVVITSVWAGIQMDTDTQVSLCGADDRVLSDDVRVGRLEPSGCTAWLINDCNNCLLTAGHCIGNEDLVEFNVPLSDANGNPQHPGPEDQYILDQTSIQFQSAGIGNDWAYFGCFNNSITGLSAATAQGDFFVLADAAPDNTGQLIRITGYGSTFAPVDPTWNGAQKTHAGPYVGSPGTQVDYQTDTTGGNSGSPVIDESTGLAIGVHTHGGCSSGANHGTAIEQANLQNALANPQGVCLYPPPDNDLCHAPMDVTAGTFDFDTSGASTDGFADNLCTNGGSSDVDKDVWFRYVAPCSGEVTVDLCGSGFDTRLAVYQVGCPTTANQAIACDDDGSCGTTSTVTFTAQAGVGYMLRVGGTLGEFGPGVLSLVDGECVQAPANDDCGSAAFLGEGVTPFSTVGAATDGPDEGLACDAGGSTQIDNDIWYRHVATCDGTITVGVCDADFDTRLAVYDATCPAGPGAVIACDDDACGLQSEVSFAATAGGVYRVRLGGTDGATGSGEIALSCEEGTACPGDTNDDGQVDVNDLNNVILDWGTDGSGSGGDVTGQAPGSPPDGVVDVNDLNAVIVGWGACP